MNKYLLLLLPLFLLAVFLFGLAPVEAQYGLDVTVGKTSYSKTDTPESITTTIINTALYLVYFAFFILVLYAGIRWMTAQGNEEHVTKAKNILEAAIIGLAVISMAYAITNFVLGKVGAGKVTEAPTGKAVGEVCSTHTDCQNGLCVGSPLTCAPASGGGSPCQPSSVSINTYCAGLSDANCKNPCYPSGPGKCLAAIDIVAFCSPLGETACNTVKTNTGLCQFMGN